MENEKLLKEEATQRYGGIGSVINIRGESRKIVSKPIGNMDGVFIIKNDEVFTFIDVEPEDNSYELIKLYDGNEWIV